MTHNVLATGPLLECGVLYVIVALAVLSEHVSVTEVGRWSIEQSLPKEVDNAQDGIWRMLAAYVIYW